MLFRLTVILSSCALALVVFVQIPTSASGVPSVGGFFQDQDQKPQLANINIRNEMKNCAKCHMDTHEEWSLSRHAQSWKSPVFQAAIADLPDKGESCARCHAPDSVLLTGPGSLPLARPEYREYGVNCTTCHMNGKKYFGPHASKGHGGIVASDVYLKSEFCSSCHGQPEVNKAHDQWSSYVLSPAGKTRRKTCQKCHMPAVKRKMVKSKRRLRKNVQPERMCRTHSFEGAHTTGKAEDAADVTISFDDGMVSVEIEPNTGHSLPASEGREVRLELKLWDSAGAVVHTEKRVWDYARKVVLVPGESNEVRVKASGEVTRATAKLDLVFLKVAGRNAEEVMVIAEEEEEK